MFVSSSKEQQDSTFIDKELNMRALIFANEDYRDNNDVAKDKLNLCLKDGQLVQKTLLQFGFETVMKENLTNQQLVDVSKQFGESLDDDQIDLAVVYYSGHSAEQRQSEMNFLFGVDVQKDESGQYQGVSLQNKIYKLIKGNRIIIYILDSCRFYRDDIVEFKSTGSISQEELEIKGRYLQRQNQITEEFNFYQTQIIFACQPNKQVVEPGNAENGYLATAFCESMQNFRDWDTVIRQTMSKVNQNANGRLTMQKTESLYYNFSLRKRVWPELHEQLQSGYVEDQTFELDSDKDYSVAISRSLTVQKAVFKSKDTRCAYLQIIIDGDHKVTFEDCEFEGLGLCITTKNENNFVNFNDQNQVFQQVTISNMTIKKAPKNGLDLHQVEDPLVQNSTILSSQWHGCIFKNCGFEGKVLDCFIQGSGLYGVTLNDTTIRHRNVIFKENDLNVCTRYHGDWQPYQD